MSDQELADRFIVPRLKDYDIEYIKAAIASLSPADKLDVIDRVDSYINRENFLGYYFKKLVGLLASIPSIERDDILNRANAYINKSESQISDMIEIIQSIYGIPSNERDDVINISNRYFQQDYKPWEIRDLIYSVKHIPVDKRPDAIELADLFLIPPPNTRQKVCITLNYIRNMKEGISKLQKVAQTIKYLTEVCKFTISDEIVCNCLCEAVVNAPDLVSKLSASIVNESIQSKAFIRACEAGQFTGFEALFTQGFLPTQETVSEMVIKSAAAGSSKIVQTLVIGVGATETDQESITDEIAKKLITNNLIPSNESIRAAVDQVIEKCKTNQDLGLDISHYQEVLPHLQTALNPQPGNEDQLYIIKIAEFLP